MFLLWFECFSRILNVLQVYDNSKHWMSNNSPYVIWYQQCFTQNAQHITKNWMFSHKNSLFPNIFFLFVASMRFFSTQKKIICESKKYQHICVVMQFSVLLFILRIHSYMIEYIIISTKILNEIRKPLRHAFIYCLHDFHIIRIFHPHAHIFIKLNQCENWDEKFILIFFSYIFSFWGRIKMYWGQWTDVCVYIFNAWSFHNSLNFNRLGWKLMNDTFVKIIFLLLTK